MSANLQALGSAKAIKEKRQEIIAEMQLITEKVKAENRNITQEENETLSKLDGQQEDFAKRAESLEKIEHVNSLSQMELRDQIISSPYHQGGKPFKSGEERMKALQGWFYGKSPKNKPEYWRAAERADIDINSPMLRLDPNPWVQGWNETRSSSGQVIGSNAPGAYTVAVDNSFMGQIDTAMKHYGQILNTSTVIDTQTGAPLPIIKMDDTANSGAYTAEQSPVTTLDVAFGKDTMNAFEIDSNAVNVSWELMQDNALQSGFVGFLAEALGTRLGRKLNNEVIAGAGGANAITGVMTNMTRGNQSTSTTSAGPTYADLVTLIESVDYAYQSNPGCGFLFNQAFRGLVRQILDENNRPIIWSLIDSLSTGLKQAILDYPYYINAAIQSWGHGASGSGAGGGDKCAVFGDLRKIYVRRVTGSEGGYNFVRNDFIYGLNKETVFFIWGRFDALLQSNGNAVKYFQAPNS